MSDGDSDQREEREAQEEEEDEEEQNNQLEEEIDILYNTLNRNLTEREITEFAIDILTKLGYKQIYNLVIYRYPNTKVAINANRVLVKLANILT